MSIQNTYPVFEADQVLTNDHLNSLSIYLEQQERLTRSKLIGCGIVCGLEISFTGQTIRVSKGCALTSQGYLVTFCETTYTSFIPYITREFMKDRPGGLPADWPLIKQCGEASTESIPFYKPAFDQNIFQLITGNQFEDLDADEREEAGLISQTELKLEEYIVVLFLETETLNLKNCDTNDCNDKGSMMEFEVKALLVHRSILDKIMGQNNEPSPGKAKLNHVELMRYNVEVTNLLSAADVLKKFKELVPDNLLQRLAENYNYCWQHYGFLLKEEPVNPFTALFTDLKNRRDTIHPILIQYFYDFIDDLVKAFYEFKYKVFDAYYECCPDEMKFPFHIMLGEANRNTATSYHSAYRQYFIYSPLFDSQGKRLGEIRSLFMRMKLMVQEFSLTDPHDFEQRAITDFANKTIKITPSRYRQAFLSDRCIPYYYKVVDKGNELYPWWNHEKTRRGNAAFNLGYNAPMYNTADTVRNPLLYDIERFDFFRIEGHIGKGINEALNEMQMMKRKYNLPFDIVALSADYFGNILRGENPKCMIHDLESDYRVLVVEFICKLHNVFCTISRIPFGADTLLRINELNATAGMTAEVLNAEGNILMNILRTMIIKEDHDSIAEMVNNFIASKGYKKGKMLSALCGPLSQNTVGAKYISFKGGPIPQELQSNIVYGWYFRFLDNIEDLFLVLLSADLSELDIQTFSREYHQYEGTTGALGILLVKFLKNKDRDFDVDYWLTSFMEILHTCILERLIALKTEYKRRLQKYLDAKNFGIYFNKHNGLEHKAGVPYGGTFVVVYHEKSPTIVKDTRFLTGSKAEFFGVDHTMLMNEALEKDAPLASRMYASLIKFMETCTDMDDETKAGITGILINRKQRPQKDPIPDQVIIADFYVPYLCCSDCPPVAYILPSVTLRAYPDDPVCDESGKKYTVSISVSGGTAPYTYLINGVSQADNKITLPSGSADTTVAVKDAAGNSTDVLIKGHSCCNLPCKGIAEICSYAVWVPRPDNDHKIAHEVKNAAFVLTDENNISTNVPVVDLFQGILNGLVLTKNNFDTTFAALVEKLNNVVPANFITPGRPMFTYEGDKKQALVIEKFPCQKFSLTIEMSNVIIDDRSFVLRITYDEIKGMVIEDIRRQLVTTVPKFDCSGIDKCNNDATVKLCTEQLVITKVKAVRQHTTTRSYKFSTLETFDKYYWFFPEGEPLYSDKAVTDPVTFGNQPNTVVRVIGIKKDTGCFAIFSGTVDL